MGQWSLHLTERSLTFVERVSVILSRLLNQKLHPLRLRPDRI